MSNRDRLLGRLRRGDLLEIVQTEIDYYMAFYRDSSEAEEAATWNETHAFVDADARIDSEGTAAEKSAFRQILIDVGYYRLMTPEEITSTVRVGSGKPWSFKIRGIAYTSDHGLAYWLSH